MDGSKEIMLPFDLPAIPEYSTLPKYNGRNFIFDDINTPVLEYSENFSGWSDDLSLLHEDSVGDAHPIDIASRYDALLQVKKIMSYDSKGVIMEIGCSSGFLLRDLVKIFPKAVIIGADVVREPLYRFARNFPGIPLMRFDLLRCPLPNNILDVLIMLNVLEHIEDDVGALKKAYNLLKPGGSLIMEVPAGPSLYDDYDKELLHFRRYSAAELQRKLVEVGFTISRASHLGFLLFPAFALVKLLHKWFRPQKNKSVVQSQAGSTSASGLFKLVMEFESRYLTNFRLPFGIRILVVATKCKS